MLLMTWCNDNWCDFKYFIGFGRDRELGEAEMDLFISPLSVYNNVVCCIIRLRAF